MFESVQEFWIESMKIDEVRWIVWLSSLLILVLIAVYIVFFFRNMAIGRTDNSSEDLTLFRQLKDEGKLNEQEFKDLKAAIPHNLHVKDATKQDSND